MIAGIVAEGVARLLDSAAGGVVAKAGPIA